MGRTLLENRMEIFKFFFFQFLHALLRCMQVSLNRVTSTAWTTPQRHRQVFTCVGHVGAHGCRQIQQCTLHAGHMYVYPHYIDVPPVTGPHHASNVRFPVRTILLFVSGTLRLHAQHHAKCRACHTLCYRCLLYTSPSPRDRTRSRMPSSA